MTQRRRVLVLLGGLGIGGASTSQANPQGAHDAWVAEALQRMMTVKPGMIRGDLLKVFTTEGGLSTGLSRRYVNRDCRYFKVDVEFEAVGRPNHDGDGRVTLAEDNRDVIRTISRPYLQFSIMD